MNRVKTHTLLFFEHTCYDQFRNNSFILVFLLTKYQQEREHILLIEFSILIESKLKR